MKKYNLIIFFSVIIYLCLACISGYLMTNVESRHNNAYRVEINRIMNQLTDINSLNNINLDQYQYIKNIEFLSIDIQNQTTINQFYLEDNESQVLPFYSNQQLLGYIKIIYQMPNINISTIFIILQTTLGILELFVLSILFYLKKQIIQPFVRLIDLPKELSKGHFKGDIKEEKNQYLGQFMRGIGQLKDSLDISKKRELEVIKDKKKMILSLSHDIKTPLNLIKLYSKALNENIYDNEESKKHAINQISDKTIEIEKYLNDIIHSSREDVLDLPVSNSEFYLQNLLHKVLKIYREQCVLRQIELSVDDFDNKLLKGDIERSQEVLENIFENVFKYGDGRQIKISFYEEDNCQIIRIFNTGIPVTDNDFNHIFDSFFRGVNSQGQQGSGLGLYICHELMRKMDGAIFAEKCQDGMALHVVFRQ